MADQNTNLYEFGPIVEKDAGLSSPLPATPQMANAVMRLAQVDFQSYEQMRAELPDNASPQQLDICHTAGIRAINRERIAQRLGARAAS